MSESDVDNALMKSMKIDAEKQMLLDRLNGVKLQLSTQIALLHNSLKDESMVTRLELVKEYKLIVERVVNNPTYVTTSDLNSLLNDVQTFLKN